VTAAAGPAHLELPRTDDVKHPARFMLHKLRPTFAAVVRRRWNLELRGTENVPASGPVVLAGNHVGFLDGPLMAIVSPRAAHALTKAELYTGPLGAFLIAAGQIPVRRDEVDPLAVRTTLRVLREGGVAGLFPESTRGSGEIEHVYGGAAYFALATGATVVPVSFLGTRLPGGSSNSVPPAGNRMVVSYGPPIEVTEQRWPRRRHEVDALSETIQQAMLANCRDAERATGMRLPGPIPDRTTSKDEQ